MADKAENKKIVIVGGGAAGFFAAIRVAEQAPGASVVILEGTRKLLTKVRISGGGRCNVTHNCMIPSELVENYPRGKKELRGPFSQFHAADTVSWFEKRGVPLKAESDGRMFSVTDKSETIIKCLTGAAQNSGVTIQTGKKVTGIQKTDDGYFEIQIHKEDPLRCDKVMIASGSSVQMFDVIKSLGHSIIDPVPSLFTFNIENDRRLHEIPGVSVPLAELLLKPVGSKKKFRQSGPLLVTHWGLSGPAVLKLSAWAARELYDSNYEASLIINWLPSTDKEKLEEFFRGQRESGPNKLLSKVIPEGIPKRLWAKLLAFCDLPDALTLGQLKNKSLERMILEVTQGSYRVCGKGVFKEEFVTCGGVHLKEINFKKMESLKVPGLYFGGEVLNIDGITGGFNFQNAWTTGWIAGTNMACDDLMASSD